MGRKCSKNFLDEKIKTKDYFDSRKISLLLKYGFPFDRKKNSYTQREINEIDELMKKIEDIDSLTLNYLTPKECGLLIRNGLYMELRVFLQNGFRSVEYNKIKNKVNELNNSSTKDRTDKLFEVEDNEPVKPRKPRINTKKLDAIYQLIKSAGGLNELEVRTLISSIGYKLEGTLTEKQSEQEIDV